MTREELLSLTVGDSLQNTMDIKAFTSFTQLKDDARWSKPAEIVKISCVKEDIAGKLFVMGETTHGANATITFSIKEGEVHYKKA